MSTQDLPNQLRQAVKRCDLRVIEKIVKGAPYRDAPRLLTLGLEFVLDTHPDRIGDIKEDDAMVMVNLLLQDKQPILPIHLDSAVVLGWEHVLGVLIRHIGQNQGVKQLAQVVCTPQSVAQAADPLDNPTPLSQAVIHGQAGMLTALLRPIERAGRSLENQSLIHALVKMEDLYSGGDRIKCLGLLIKHGAQINIHDERGYGPLHVVNSEAMARALLEAGADPRHQTSRGNRPMFELWNRRGGMKKEESLGIAQALVEAGAKWSDGPVMDVLKQQMGDHPLTEWLAKGRVRSELGEHAQRPANPAPGRRF